MRHREKRFGPGGIPPSQVDGGVANYGFAKWFHMYKGNDDVPTAERVQYGTVTDFDDGRPSTADENSDSPSQHASPDNELPMMPMPSSQVSLPSQAQLGCYDAGCQNQPRPGPGPLIRRDTVGSDSSCQHPSLARAGTWASQQPRSFGPPARSATFQPPHLHRAGTMPLPEHVHGGPHGLRRMGSLTHTGLQRSDSFGPIQRTMTENPACMQSHVRDPYPTMGIQRTGSFPYSFQGEHIASTNMTPLRYQTPPPLPSQAGAGWLSYPDTRFLRPDMHAQATGELPYPDDHPERVPFPGDRPPPGQGLGQMYPNYQYADRIYDRPR